MGEKDSAIFEDAAGTRYQVQKGYVVGTYKVYEMYKYSTVWRPSIEFPSRWWKHRENAEKALEKYAAEHSWKKAR